MSSCTGISSTFGMCHFYMSPRCERCDRFAPGDIILRLQDDESDSDGANLEMPTIDVRGKGSDITASGVNVASWKIHYGNRMQ